MVGPRTLQIEEWWGRDLSSCVGHEKLHIFILALFEKTVIGPFSKPERVLFRRVLFPGGPPGPPPDPQKCAAHRGDPIPLGFVQIHCNRTSFRAILRFSNRNAKGRGGASLPPGKGPSGKGPFLFFFCYGRGNVLSNTIGYPKRAQSPQNLVFGQEIVELRSPDLWGVPFDEEFHARFAHEDPKAVRTQFKG